jgi:membrane protein involved in colicin uptake
MAAPVMVMISVVMHVIAIKRLMWAHGEHETSTRGAVAGRSGALDLINFERHQAKLRFGVAF